MSPFARALALLLPLAPQIVTAGEIAPGLTLDGSVTLELRHTNFGALAGVRLSPHLRWTASSGQFGVDLGTDLWREPDGLTLADITYGSVFARVAGGELHLGLPKSAVETVLTFPKFSTSSPDSEMATLYTRTRFYATAFEGTEAVRAALWTRDFGQLQLAASVHIWRTEGVTETLPSTQLALRYENGGTVLMAGAEVAETTMGIFGLYRTSAYHLAALQSVGDWRLGVMYNRYDDGLVGINALTRLHIDHDITPNLNIWAQYQRMDGPLGFDTYSLNLRYDVPNQPLFLEAGLVHGEMSSNMLQTGLGLKF